MFWILLGAAMGVLAWYAIADILRGAMSTGSVWAMATAAVVGAAAGGLYQRAFCAVIIAVGIVFAVVVLTPLTQWLVSRAVRADALRHADAIVALDAGRGSTGVPSPATYRRFTHALALYRDGWAPALVVSIGRARAGIPHERTVQLELGPLTGHKDVVVLPPGESTRDEAVATAKLAKQHGWQTIILVTDALHMRRAAATFTKVGLEVICAPCGTPEYDTEHLSTVPARVYAFRDWLHEMIGLVVYRRRGWI